MIRSLSLICNMLLLALNFDSLKETRRRLLKNKHTKNIDDLRAFKPVPPSYKIN